MMPVRWWRVWAGVVVVLGAVWAGSWWVTGISDTWMTEPAIITSMAVGVLGAALIIREVVR